MEWYWRQNEPIIESLKIPNRYFTPTGIFGKGLLLEQDHKCLLIDLTLLLGPLYAAFAKVNDVFLEQLLAFNHLLDEL